MPRETRSPGKVLFDSWEIENRVMSLGGEICNDFLDKDFMAICVEKGAVFFFADLIRAIHLPMEIGFMQIDANYGGATTSGGAPRIRMDPKLEIKGKHILIVEDIVDSGFSMEDASRHLREGGAKSVKVAAFLDKPKARKTEFKPDYVGFTIEPFFVVGYGLDFGQKYRLCPTVNALPNFAGVTKPEKFFQPAAENCLVLGDKVGPDDLEDLIAIARDFGAVYPPERESFLVSRGKASQQVVVREDELLGWLTEIEEAARERV